jgi:hypothetical protein
MARKKTTKRSTKKRKTTKRKRIGWLNRIPEIPAGPATTAFTWITLVGVLTAAWFFGVPRLRAAVIEQTPAVPTAIEFSEVPVWVDTQLRAELEGTARLMLSGDPFTQTDLAGVRSALGATGWFESVDQVRRVTIDRIRVQATFARPFAMVRDRGRDYLVDPMGRLLPRSYTPGKNGAELIPIINAHFHRPEKPGRHWEGADVNAALRILRLLDGRPWFAQIEHVDLRHGAEGVLLVTDIGARIHWGSPPGEEEVLEPTARRKLAFLDKAYEDSRRVDLGHTSTWRFYEDVFTAE